MPLLNRLWRHCLTTSATGRRTFPPDALRKIQATIAQGERVHRAEIKVIVETSLPLLDILRKQSSRDRARALFSEYRLWDTEENSGVLIYLNLADHKVEIIADRGIDRLLARTDWNALCATMANGFAQGVFHDSVIAALTELNRQLQLHAPNRDVSGEQDNQLSDTPLML